jgi:hypothetical protein
MEVSVPVDGFTPCLIHRETGKVLKTAIKKYTPKKNDLRNWKFDWTLPINQRYEVYALTLENDDELQGLIALKDEQNNMAIHIDILETAPHNYGSQGKYEGVGGHLFAFAGKLSIEKGYGFIYFDAKTDLIEYYKKRLGAKQLGTSQRMVLEGEELLRLVEAYYGGEHDEK